MTQTIKKRESAMFSKNLRELMKEKGVTVRETAKKAGISPSTLDDWRGGAVPGDYVAVKRLAGFLGVSLSFLLTGEDESHPSGWAPSLVEVFEDGGDLFEGYAKIRIQKLVPRKGFR